MKEEEMRNNEDISFVILLLLFICWHRIKPKKKEKQRDVQ